MNATHIHLLINHLAVIGALLGIIVLLFAVYTNTQNTYYAAYAVLIISVLGTVIAYATGESAEETIEGISGVAGSAVDPHEDSALITILSFSLLGIIVLISIVMTRFKKDSQRVMAVIVLVTGVVSFSFAARTAWLGGKIRHTELTGNPTPLDPSADEDD